LGGRSDLEIGAAHPVPKKKSGTSQARKIRRTHIVKKGRWKSSRA
jgi:hypothetical protein